jgi:hypothetical protein
MGNYASSSLAAIGRGELLIASEPLKDEVARVSRGRIEYELVGSAGPITSVAFVPRMGRAVAGSAAGELFERVSPGVWRHLGTAEGGRRINTLAPFRGGFLAGGAQQSLVQYVPGEPLCPVQTGGGNDHGFIIAFGRRLITAGGAPDFHGDESAVTILATNTSSISE